jgi:hypothetical protein
VKELLLPLPIPPPDPPVAPFPFLCGPPPPLDVIVEKTELEPFNGLPPDDAKPAPPAPTVTV